MLAAGLELLKTFLHLLPKHKDWGKLAHSRSVFCIDDHFSITGVGTTVSLSWPNMMVMVSITRECIW